jgi:histidine triad (HIT) family protein
MPNTEVDERKDRHSAGKPGSSVNQPLKKGGGGGKFTAGKLGAEAGDLDVLDKNDPNYDSEGEEPEKPNNDTFFDKIVRGELEIASVFEDELCCAVEETHNPQAATHYLMFPKERITGLKHCGQKQEAVLGHMMASIAQMCRIQKVNNYRVVIEQGKKQGRQGDYLYANILAD